MKLKQILESITIKEEFSDSDFNKLTQALENDKFVTAMYEWFQDNWADAPIYGGDATPDDYLELLESSATDKMKAKFMKDMKSFI